METQQKLLHTQVAIVGAGPTGLSLAMQLLRYNIDFIIIEKNEKTTLLSKAVVVQARTLEIFAEAGIAGKAVEEGRLTTAMNMYYKGRKKAGVDLAGLGNGVSPFPFALSLEQSKTEKLLVDYLYANGKTIQWNTAFSHYEQDDAGVKVYYKDAEGREQVTEAKYIVGCDGSHSLIRHQAGMNFEGDTVPKIFYVTDVILKSPVINKDELYMFLIEKGFVLFFPMEGTGHYRIVGILPNQSPDQEFNFHDVENFIKEQIISPVEFKEVKWFSNYKVHSRMASSFRDRRCFIAGDAAHIHTPAGGQGMNTGIQDAYNLTWKLAYAIKGKADNSILESYNTERMQNAKHLLNTTDRMFDIMAGTNKFRNYVRLKIFPPVLKFVSKNSVFNKRIFPLLSQTSISYPGSVLTIKSSIAKVKAGVRMPYFTFSNGKNIFDLIAQPAFKILFFGSDGNDYFELLKNVHLDIVTLSFSEIPKSIFKASSDFYILLRPDNHISYIGKDLSSCKTLLDKITLQV